MTKRKRPEGEEFEDFCKQWDENDHEHKIRLAADYGVTYDTMKHWRSESEVPTRKQVRPEERMVVTEDELLGMRPSVQLDFVCFDIETSNLNADFSILLSAAIKPFGKPPIMFRADDYPTWETNKANDSMITFDISEELKKHAIVIGHYSQKFDIPFLRAKMAKHHLEPLPPMFGIDSWRIAKNNFKVSSRRLKNLASYFEVGDKEGVDGGLWMEAAYNGDKEALDKIVEHNIIDVAVLERLAAISFPFLKSIPRL
uniref:Putative RNase_H superfamily protein n=1 Tax=viral metagenome TaxID=1070528 RepID=A0A6H2A104_9ZZZZ